MVASRKYKGSGYLTDQQFFNPDVLPPSEGSLSSHHSSYPTNNEIRPVLVSTFKAAGGKKSRKHRKTSRRHNGGYAGVPHGFPHLGGPASASASASASPPAPASAPALGPGPVGIPHKGGVSSRRKANATRKQTRKNGNSFFKMFGGFLNLPPLPPAISALLNQK